MTDKLTLVNEITNYVQTTVNPKLFEPSPNDVSFALPYGRELLKIGQIVRLQLNYGVFDFKIVSQAENA